MVVRDLFRGLYRPCKCGCGKLILLMKKDRIAFRNYELGHNSKGENNPSWIGGRIEASGGYWKLLMPEYFSSVKDGYILEHVYFYQEYHKCCMLPWGVVHHIDGNKHNNMIWNLQGMTKKQHTKLHSQKDMSNRICSNCGKNYTIIEKRSGYQLWCKDGKGGYICNKCKCKEYWRIHGKERIEKRRLKKLKI